MKVKSNQEIIDFCSKYAKETGVEIVDVEFKQGKNPSLTIYIEKQGGVDLNACESFHRAILEPLDELDPTCGSPYVLNVSSLGADRPFKTEKDYLTHINKMVEVRLVNGVKGKKFIEGVLLSYNGKQIVIKVDDKTTLSLELKNVVKVNEYIDLN